MKTCAVYHNTQLIADQVAIADSFFTRFRGLMLRKSLAPGEGLFLKNCSAIHCCFMRFPIDVVYLDDSMKVVGIETVKPWHLGSIFPGAKHVLELESGCARELAPGIQLELEGVQQIMSDNLVKDLREKTEEADLDSILKVSIGGYNRKLVREYIAMMRQQQYDMQQSFAEELQMAQNERELLVEEAAKANERAATAEEAMANAQPLLDKAADLEKDLNEAVARIQADEALMAKKADDLEMLKLECEELRENLEKKEIEAIALKREVASYASRVYEAVPVVPEVVPSPDVTELQETIDRLQVQLSIITRERDDTEKRMQNVIENEKRLFKALSDCRTEMENRRDQNLCLEAENKALTQRLTDQMVQNISLDREITQMRTMNDTLKAKVDAARAESAQALDGGKLLLWDSEN